MSAGRLNEVFYDRFWQDCPDFTRHNPGARHRRRISLQMVSTIAGSSLLDVGCGSGELLVTLQHARPHITTFVGVDISGETIEKNKARLSHMEFAKLDISVESLDRDFDIVTCSEVVEHLDDRRVAFEHLARMVAPGGHLLVTCPTGRLYATEKFFGHVDHPTAQELDDHARAAGLQPVEIRTWGWPLYKAMKWATNINAPWAIKNFASDSYSRSAKLVSNALYWANYLNLSRGEGCQLFGLFRRPTPQGT